MQWHLGQKLGVHELQGIARKSEEIWEDMGSMEKSSELLTTKSAKAAKVIKSATCLKESDLILAVLSSRTNIYRIQNSDK